MRRPPPRKTTAPAAAPTKLAERLPLRILVADDLRSNQEVLSLMLRHLGYEPVAVTGGAQALEAIRARPFDLLLLDLNMPEVDGYQVAQAVIALFPQVARRPKMVAVSVDDPAVVKRARAAGMDGFIPKPLTLSDVGRSLLQLFGGG